MYCGILFFPAPESIHRILHKKFNVSDLHPYRVENEAHSYELIHKMYGHHVWLRDEKIKKIVANRFPSFPKTIYFFTFSHYPLEYVIRIKNKIRSEWGKKYFIHITDNALESNILLSFLRS